MAGRKETPRQKMIGMMYLVLTALLALQVSSAVLEKFAIINVTLEDLAQETSVKNQALTDAIVAEGEKKTSPKVKSAVQRAQQVRDLTKESLAKLEQLKKEMVKRSNSEQIDERVINDHGSGVETMMIDPRSSVGKDFEKTLNDYVAKVSELSGQKFEKLAKAPSEMEFFKADPNHSKKDFLTFMFENTPPIAAIASVTEFQTQMLDIESQALTALSREAEAGTVKFETVVPMVQPTSSVVAAGSKYEAKLFVAAAAEGTTPQMFRNGQPVPTVPILCGHFGAFLEGRWDPAKHEPFTAAVNALRAMMASRRTLVVAAADLAHVGPAFGDPYGLDFVGRAQLRNADERLLRAVHAGDETAFFEQLKAEGDRRHVCGLPPIYLTLRLLGEVRGEPAGYALCPADPQGVSFVSIAGVILR
jgi:hypothetical protein